MRFRAPRSVSPSPVRGKPRNSSTFGLQPESDSEEYDSELDSSSNSDFDDDVSIASTSSAGSSSLSLIADINQLSLRPRHIPRTPQEERKIEETVASIRLHSRYNDPYEAWEKKIREDAFKTARKEFELTQTHLYEQQMRLNAQAARHRAEQSARHIAIVHKSVEGYKALALEKEIELKKGWALREKELWDRVEAAIKLEEDKVAKRLEEEKRIRDEEERRRKDAELKRRLAEEKKVQEETKRRKAEEEKKRAEEERNRQEKEEEEERKRLDEDESRRLKEEGDLREKLFFTPAAEDWRMTRTDLHNLKTGPIAHVKGNSALRPLWGKFRRQIIPKIGQLTNDAQSISEISQQLISIAKPPQPHELALYICVCSSLAKAILMQAETEVTAEKRSAEPLAQVAFNLLQALEHFPTIFFARLVQRCGNWPIPFIIPPFDIDEEPWPSKEAHSKASGVRKSNKSDGLENIEEYSNRVSANMRVYFHILKIRPTNQPLQPMFQLPRVWSWFARLIRDPRLLKDPVAPQLLYTGLDVVGLEGLELWGKQWVKMLALIYEGITTGYQDGKLIGGETSVADAARTRITVTLESIVAGVQS